MQVDVEDRHPRSLPAQHLRRDRRIVDEAEAAGDVGKGVMAGRTAQRIGSRRARHYRVGGLDRAPGAPQRAPPGLAGDRASGIGHVVAGLADRRGRIRAAPRDRMDVGDHFGRSAFDSLPAREDVLEKIEIFGRMHSGNRTKPVISRPFDRAAGSLGAGEQPFDALRLFRIGLLGAAGEERLGIVALLLFGIKGFHDFPHSSGASAKAKNASPTIFCTCS